MKLIDFNRTVPYIKKKGIAGYFQIIYHNFFSLVLLNFVFLLTALPVFTVGAAYKALISVCNKYTKDKVVYPMHEYFKSFKNKFLKSAIYGIVFAVTVVIISYSCLFYLNLSKENFVFYIFSFIGVICIFIIIMLVCWFFPLLAKTKADFLQLVKKSFTLSVAYIKESMAFLTFCLLCFAVVFAFFPLSVPFVAIFPFVLVALCSCFVTNNKI